MPIPNTIDAVDNITDLKTIIGTNDGDTIEVLGYYTPNDGGGGQFIEGIVFFFSTDKVFPQNFKLRLFTNSL